MDGFRLVLTAEGKGNVGALFQGSARNNYSFVKVSPEGLSVGGGHGRLLKMASMMVEWCGDSPRVHPSQRVRPIERRLLKLLGFNR